MTRQQERDEFIGILLQEFPNHKYADICELARKLMRYAATDDRFACQDCNEGLSAEEEERQKANQQRILSLCREWGIVPVFNGDPRGATVKLQVPSGRKNDWGQVGICVPAGN